MNAAKKAESPELCPKPPPRLVGEIYSKGVQRKVDSELVPSDENAFKVDPVAFVLPAMDLDDGQTAEMWELAQQYEQRLTLVALDAVKSLQDFVSRLENSSEADVEARNQSKERKRCVPSKLMRLSWSTGSGALRRQNL